MIDYAAAIAPTEPMAEGNEADPLPVSSLLLMAGFAWAVASHRSSIAVVTECQLLVVASEDPAPARGAMWLEGEPGRGGEIS
jgi:hypothetical protein